MPRHRSLFAACFAAGALSGCAGAGNESGPDAAGIVVPTFEVDPT